MCDVVTRSFFSLIISQFGNMMVCLFPKLSSVIRFKMMDAILRLVIFNVINCWSLQYFVVSLTWVM